MSEEVKARENLEKAAFLQCAPLTNLMNCARRYYFAFSFLFLSLFGFVCEVHAQTAAGPLRVFSANPRYFTDGTGVAVFLTGAHEGWELQDNAFESARIFDWTGYLNFLQAHNMNFIRMWTIQLTRTGRPGSSSASPLATPMPYVRSTICCALDGQNKFDLNTFNQAYFDRLRSRVIDAGSRGIYVSYMFFAGFQNPSGPDYDWFGHPFNASNNINGINGDVDGDGRGDDDIHRLASTQITQLQESYVRKVIDTVNDLDNVAYQVANETGDVPWNYHFIDYIHSYEAGMPKQHPVGMVERSDFANYTATQMTQELYNSNAEFISPSLKLTTPFGNGAVGDGRKVIVADTDHGGAYSTNPAIPWKLFTQGAGAVWLLDDSTDWTTTSPYESIRMNAGYVRTYADKMNLAAMTPQGSLSSTAYALANPGTEYLVYQPGTGAFTLNMVAGTYLYEWFNPTAGNIAETGTITALTGNRTFTPPFSGAAVLYLYLPPPDTIPPTVSITSPASGSVYTTPQTIVITASASDNVGVIKVEFYDNRVLKAIDTTSPYSYNWSIGATDNGSHAWTARAYDFAGNTITSDPVTVTVSIVAPPDTTPPAQVTNFAASPSNVTAKSTLLTWTASGDDGKVGTATSYDIRYSTLPLTSSNWASAIQATGESVPKPAGSAESYTLPGLTANTKYYIGLKVIDDAGNISPLSNIVQITTKKK